MTIQDLGAIGELVSAVAILVTLGYLAVQVKYAKMATVDRNRDARVSGIIEINSRFANNPDLRKEFDKTTGDDWRNMLRDFASSWGVSEEEASAVFWTQSDFVWLHWAQYRSTKTIEDKNELENIVSVWYSAPPMSTMFANETCRANFDHEFISWVDAVLSKRDA
jgi:hypothetical protein